MIVLSIIGYLLLLLSMTILLILIIPVNYSANGQKEEAFSINAHVTWLFRLISFDAGYDSESGAQSSLRFFGKSKGFDKSPEKKEEKEKEKKKSSSDFRDFLDKGLLDSGIRFIKDFFKHLKPTEFHAAGRVGFDDPYDTAVMSSIISSMNIPGINVEPVFDEEVIEGYFIIRGRLIIGVIVWLFIRFLLTKPVRNIFKKRFIRMIQNKKGERTYVRQSE